MDYYKILGLQKNASKDDIKKAYRTLAKKYHPDANNGIEDPRFKDIQAAYDTLSDDTKRATYDNPFTNNPFTNNMNFGGGASAWSGFPHQSSQQINIDIRTSITINSLKELNKDVVVQFQRTIVQGNATNIVNDVVSIPVAKGVVWTKKINNTTGREVLVGSYHFPQRGNIYQSIAGSLTVGITVIIDEGYTVENGCDIVQTKKISLHDLLFLDKIRVTTLFDKDIEIALRNFKDLNSIAVQKSGDGLFDIRTGHTGKYIIRFVVQKPNLSNLSELEMIEIKMLMMKV